MFVARLAIRQVTLRVPARASSGTAVPELRRLLRRSALMGKKRKMAADGGEVELDPDTPRHIKYRQMLGKLPVPHSVQLLVTGTGRHSTPCGIMISTDHCRYLFNCGEGTQRVFSEHKLKISRMEHIFITHGSWKNISGLLGTCLSMEMSQFPVISVHGPPHVEKVVSLATSFAQLFKAELVKHEAEEGKFFEDETMKIEYVPMFSSDYTPPPPTTTTESTSESENPALQSRELAVQMTVAYVCKPQPLPRSVSPEKIVELKVPRNESIGKLVHGEEVTLPDGRLIKPDDILGDRVPIKTFIVMECPNHSFLDSLCSNQRLQQVAAAAAAPDAVEQDNGVQLVVHMTPADVLATDKYQEWMNRFDASTTHIILNEDGSAVVSEAIYVMQAKLNLLHDSIYPLLPHQINQEPYKGKPDIADNIVYGETNLSYDLRKHKLGRSNCITLDNELYTSEVLDRVDVQCQLKKTKELVAHASKDLDHSDHYPEVIFLGTGSAIPSKVRNVSATLLHLSAEQCMLLDCGENTLGQLWRHYGPETPAVLAKISAVFVSHLHADHHMGTISVAYARKQALDSEGKEFTPVLLLAPYVMEGWFETMHNQLIPIEHLIRVVKLESLYLQEGVEYSINGDRKRTQLFGTDAKPAKLGAYSPEEYQNILSLLSLKEFQPVPVLHRQYPHGVFLTHNSGWRLGYSGDTIPCERLIKAGQNCDLLIHEATLEDEMKLEAGKKRHSTTSQAIDVGMRMNAGFILLTHFSQRYPKLPMFNDKFSDKVGCAFDNMRVRKCDLPLLPLFRPGLQAVFAEYVSDMEEATKKRQMGKILKAKYAASQTPIVPPKQKGRNNQPKKKGGTAGGAVDGGAGSQVKLTLQKSDESAVSAMDTEDAMNSASSETVSSEAEASGSKTSESGPMDVTTSSK